MYVYTPLNHDKKTIRLLWPEFSGDAASPIRGCLREFELESAPPFKALSYTWGDPEPTYEILIRNGETEYQKFSVRQNLHQFLMMKTGGMESYLWIDQICINQANVHERNHQVQQMADIYKSAQAALCWLGPGFPDSDKVMADLGNTAEIDRVMTLSKKEFKRQRLPFLRSLREAFRTFFAVPYFSRIWIMQEVLLSRHRIMILGNDTLDWGPSHASESTQGQSFDWVMANFQGVDKVFPRYEIMPFLMLDGKMSIDNSHGITWTWVRALDFSVSAECVEPRDRFFALLGLVCEACRIPVDYSMDLVDIIRSMLLKEIEFESCGKKASLEDFLHILRTGIECRDRFKLEAALTDKQLRNFVADNAVAIVQAMEPHRPNLRFTTFRALFFTLARAHQLSDFRFLKGAEYSKGFRKAI